jgi:hypothetical protein
MTSETDQTERPYSNPYILARMADCASPDTKDSPGARWLVGLAQDIASEHNDWTDVADVDDVRDEIAERADQLVPTYTREIWLVFVDLAAYQEDVSEYGPIEDMERAATTALYMIAERLMTAVAEEIIATTRPTIPDMMGGYRLIAIMDDGGALCETCVRDESNPVHAHGDADGWRVDGWSTTGETDDYTACDHCGKVLVDGDETGTDDDQ